VPRTTASILERFYEREDASPHNAANVQFFKCEDTLQQHKRSMQQHPVGLRTGTFPLPAEAGSPQGQKLMGMSEHAIPTRAEEAKRTITTCIAT
jgi:hypothetical protein